MKALGNQFERIFSKDDGRAAAGIHIMKRLKVMAACGVIFVLAWMVMYPSSRYRFRLTINVETPDGVKSGSSVMEVVARRAPAWTELSSGPHAVGAQYSGEAVFVDLGSDANGNKRNLVGLLGWGPRGEGGWDFYTLPNRIYKDLIIKQIREETAEDFALSNKFFGPPNDLQRERNRKRNRCGDSFCRLERISVGTKVEVRPSDIPTLVTFPDLNDPKRLSEVDPINLGETFGPGYYLRNVTFEFVPAGTWPLTLLGLSGEPLTRDIERNLPLMRNIKRPEGMRITRLGDPIRLEEDHLKHH